MNLKLLLRAFAHPNFRLFFAGQSLSLIGTWMQQLAVAWLVFLLTQSGFWLGVAGFFGQIPNLFLTPLAGVLVDRWNRHRLLLLTQSLAIAQAFLLAVLALSGVIAVWQILLLSLFLGLVNVFDMTARQAFLAEVVESREDLANAIALNSSMVHSARLVGPALAGWLLAQTSVGVCFLVNGLSYLAVLAALLAIKVPPRRREVSGTQLVQGLREGFVYAFGFAPIRALVLLLALVSLLGTSYRVLLPVFVSEVLHGGADTLGLLTAAAGLGSLAAAVWLASRKGLPGLGKWTVLAPGVFGLGLVAFSFSEVLWLSVLLLLVAGFAMTVQAAASNTVLQTIVAEDKRGRVMSLYTMAFLGMAPLGSLLAGSLAEGIGAPNTVQLAGACCIGGSLVFAAWLPHLRKLLRPSYVHIGLLPETASGSQTAMGPTVPPEKR